jgi:hypothetical protein
MCKSVKNILLLFETDPSYAKCFKNRISQYNIELISMVLQEMEESLIGSGSSLLGKNCDLLKEFD